MKFIANFFAYWYQYSQIQMNSTEDWKNFQTLIWFLGEIFRSVPENWCEDIIFIFTTCARNPKIIVGILKWIMGVWLDFKSRWFNSGDSSNLRNTVKSRYNTSAFYAKPRISRIFSSLDLTYLNANNSFKTRSKTAYNALPTPTVTLNVFQSWNFRNYSNSFT